MFPRPVLVLALVTLAACTVTARPAAAPAAPRAVLGATAAPAVLAEADEAPATAAPVMSYATLPAPTSAPYLQPGSTPEQTAERLALAIDSLDLPGIRRLIYQGGWIFAMPAGDMSLRLTRDEAVAWLRKRTPDGKIRAEMATSPLLERTEEHPPGRVYMRSMWIAFDRRDRVRVDLVLTPDSDGLWYWSGILLDAPSGSR